MSLDGNDHDAPEDAQHRKIMQRLDAIQQSQDEMKAAIDVLNTRADNHNARLNWLGC